MKREVLRNSAVTLRTCVGPSLRLSWVLCVHELRVTLTLPRFCAPLLVHCSYSLCCTDHCSLNIALQGRELKRLSERSHRSCPQTGSKGRNSNTAVWEQLWCWGAPSWIGNRDVLNRFCLSDSSYPNYSGCFLKIAVESHLNHFSSNSGFFSFQRQTLLSHQMSRVKNPHPHIWWKEHSSLTFNIII